MQEEKIKKLSYHNKEQYKYKHSTPPSYLKDFNYPSLSKKDLMYLSSLNSRDYPLRYFKKLNTKRDWSANLYNLDIEKSVPFRSNVFTNKIDFINKLDDIEKSHPNVSKNNSNFKNDFNFNLNTHDIDGAYPSKHEFSKRITNPLEPVYKLPSCEILEEDPPNKFIRNNLDISDIKGTKPKPIYRKKINNNDDNNYDISGSHPRKRYERKIFYENFDYTDVNVDSEHKKFFNNKNNRNTNPLEPNYGSLYGGFIEKSVSLNPFFHIKNRGSIYMSNDDIFGSISGSKNKYNLFLNKPKFGLDVNDIEGTKSGTLKRCSKNMILMRNSNPLIPKYEYLGEKEKKGNERYYKNNNNNISNDNINNINNINNNNNSEIINNNNQNFKTLDINDIQKNNDNNNLEKFPISKLNISKSCKDLYIPNKYEYPNFNNNINNINLNFNPENYKKSNPNYERIHNPLLLFSQKNRNNRLDVQMKKYFNINNNINTDFISNNNNNMILKDSTLKDCSIDHTKKFNLMKSRSMENLNDDINNKYNNKYLNLTYKKIKEDPLYNRYRSPPSYEEQLSEFIKDNSYNFNE